MNLFVGFAFFKKTGGQRVGSKEIIGTLFSFRTKECSNQMKFHRLSTADLFAKTALRNPREGSGDDITVP